MKKLEDSIKLESLPGTDLFITVGHQYFNSERLGRVKIQDGITTDLATIPWFLRWAYSRSGKHKDAAIAHDAALQTPGYTRKQCDQLFDEVAEDTGVTKIDRAILYAGLRTYAFFKGLS